LRFVARFFLVDRLAARSEVALVEEGSLQQEVVVEIVIRVLFDAIVVSVVVFAIAAFVEFLCFYVIELGFEVDAAVNQQCVFK